MSDPSNTQQDSGFHPASTNINPNFKRSSDFRNLYVNFIQGGFSIFDVTLIMGELAGLGENQRPLVEAKARVTMAPLEAKILQSILANILERYEAQFGPISVPTGLFSAEGGQPSDLAPDME